MRAVTAREFAERVTDLAAGLIAAGVAPGDRIGLLAPPGLAWTVCDYAIWTAGAVSVPADEHDAARLFHATGAVAVIARDHATATRTLTPPTTQRNPRATSPTPPTIPPHPDTAPQNPDAAPQVPDAAPQVPDTAPQVPDTAPQVPDTVSQDPDAVSQDPDAQPQDLNTMPQDPGGVPQDPGGAARDSGGAAQDPGGMLSGLRRALPALRAVWSIADGDLERLADGGAAVPQAVVDGRRRAVSREDPATIMNLDGTPATIMNLDESPATSPPLARGPAPIMNLDESPATSPPLARGPAPIMNLDGSPATGPSLASGPATVMDWERGPAYGVLTHGMLRDAVQAAVLPRGASVLLHRPLTRLVPRLLQLSAVHHGCRISYEPDPGAVPQRIRSLGPSVLLATPRLLAELLELARAEAYADGKGALFARAEHTAVAYGRALANGGPSRWLRAERRVFDRLCYARLRGFLGGRATHLVCDGTPDELLSAFYRGAGLTPLPVGTPAPATGT